ncbi:hypothetical protein EBR16_00645 [bacterium]|jgi:hypothetical protein|nr:hypothetical protein [bacterium]
MKKLLVLLTLGLAAFAGAADAPGGGSRSCRLLYIQAPFDAPEKVVLVVGKEATDVDLPRLSISNARAKIPSGLVRVYAATKAPTKAEPLPANTPFVDIPETMSDALIVLLPTGQPGPLSFIMLPVEFHKNRAPEGTVVWFNLSDRIIYAKLGNTMVTVNPKGSALSMPSVGIDEPYVVYVDASPVAPETETVPVVRGSWVKEARMRNLLFVVPDPSRTVPRILSIPDRLDAEPDPNAKGGNGKPAPKPAPKSKEEKKEEKKDEHPAPKQP